MTNTTRKIGAITIGQSPRDDIMAVMTPHLPDGLKVLQRGALDDLDAVTIASLRPDLSAETGDLGGPREPANELEYDILVSRMRDGSEAMMTHDRVVPLMQQKIVELESEGAEFIVLLCGGDSAW
jgi:protein AroM